MHLKFDGREHPERRRRPRATSPGDQWTEWTVSPSLHDTVVHTPSKPQVIIMFCSVSEPPLRASSGALWRDLAVPRRANTSSATEVQTKSSMARSDAACTAGAGATHLTTRVSEMYSAMTTAAYSASAGAIYVLLGAGMQALLVWSAARGSPRPKTGPKAHTDKTPGSQRTSWARRPRQHQVKRRMMRVKCLLGRMKLRANHSLDRSLHGELVDSDQQTPRSETVYEFPRARSVASPSRRPKAHRDKTPGSQRTRRAR